jgi:energy-coupling factor transporter ATP-binding protein EcfA2
MVVKMKSRSSLAERQAELRELDARLIEFRQAIIGVAQPKGMRSLARELIEREFLSLHLHSVPKNRESSSSPIEAVLRMHRRISILGEPGSGKSTLLRTLAVSSAKGRFKDLPTVPILSEFADLTVSSIQEFIVSAFSRQNIPIDMHNADTLLERGDILLLLDEISYSCSSELLQAIVDSSSLFPKLYVIDVSRPSNPLGKVPFVRYEIALLDDSEAKRLVEVWAPAFGINAELFWNTIQTSEALTSLGRNPVKLRLLLQTFANAHLSYGASELIDRSCEMFFDRSNIQLSQNQRSLAETLAAYLTETRTHWTDLKTVERVVGALGGEEFGIMSTCKSLEQNGILTREAPERLQFRNRVLQEYFAAEALNEVPAARFHNLCEHHATDHWWQPALLGALRKRQDAPQLIALLLPNTNVLLFLGLSLSEGVKLPDETQRQIVRAILQVFSTSREELYEKCTDILIRATGAVVKEECKSMLLSGRPTLLGRMYLAYILAAKGVAGSLVCDICIPQVTHKEAKIRKQAFRALGALDTLESSRILSDRLRVEEEDSVVLQILSSLLQSCALDSSTRAASTNTLLVAELENRLKRTNSCEIKTRSIDLITKLQASRDLASQ